MIRAYHKSEIQTLVDIWKQASVIAHPFLNDDFVIEVEKAMLDAYLPNSENWVYETSNEILGFISMVENEIVGLFVRPEHQGKCIGHALVNYVNHFHTKLEVEVFDLNEIGKPFYKKMGFLVFKEYIHDASGQKVLRMRKV